MKLLRAETEEAKRRSLASEMRTKLFESEIEELDLKLLNFDARRSCDGAKGEPPKGGYPGDAADPDWVPSDRCRGAPK